MKKKCFALILAVMMAVCGTVTPAKAAGNDFVDVAETHWAAKEIAAASTRKIIKGYPNHTFAPDKPVTRADFTVMLWNMAYLCSTSGRGQDYQDVLPGSYYFQAVKWATEQKIVFGKSSGRFDPNGLVTRQEIAAMLYRYTFYEYQLRVNGVPGTPENLEYSKEYRDVDRVSDYAKEAMCWAVEYMGIINGRSPKELAPQKTATRAEAAAILVRYRQGNETQRIISEATEIQYSDGGRTVTLEKELANSLKYELSSPWRKSEQVIDPEQTFLIKGSREIKIGFVLNSVFMMTIVVEDPGRPEVNGTYEVLLTGPVPAI